VTRVHRILTKFAVFIGIIAVLAILWIFSGAKVSLVVDRFWTIQSDSLPIQSVAYEGTGTGGLIQVETYRLSLTPADLHADPPHIGSTKDNQVALANGGKVFAFGPLRSNENQMLASEVQPGDAASFMIRHSRIVWPNATMLMKDLRAWRRYQYQTLLWKKKNGEKLELVWRFEQFYDPGKGWSTGAMTPGGATGLVRVDISSGAVR
jgi:hypothetical protein